MSKGAKWSYEKVEMAACVVGRAKDCLRRSLVKVLFVVGGNNFGVTVSFVCLVDLEKRRALSPLSWPRGEMRARC